MKPAQCSIVVLLALVCAVPMGGQEQDQPKEFSDLLYPIATGYKWHYRVTDLKAPKTTDPAAAKQMVIVTAGAKQAFSLRKRTKEGVDRPEQVYGYELQIQNAGKTVLEQVLAPVLEQVLVSDDGVYRVSSAGKLISPPLCILKAKAAKGTPAWKCESQSENAVIKGEFTVDQQDVQLPTVLLKGTVVVQSREFTIGTQKMQVTTWYSPGVGMVKQHVQVGKHDVILELEKFEPTK